MTTIRRNTAQQGFTLVELMVTIVISAIICGVIYSTYSTYVQHYVAQRAIVEIQENVRAALSLMADEIRMAGYNPKGSSAAAIVSATRTSLSFTKDTTDATGTATDGDGNLDGPFEDLTFGFVPGTDVSPATPDCIADSGAAPLTVTTGGSQITIANDISAIEFNYHLEDGTRSTEPAKPKDIRAVTISILARTENEDRGYSDQKTYIADSGRVWGPFSDNYRRRLLVATVFCRNMGL